MPLVECPVCGEDEALDGRRGEATIAITCGSCGQQWERSLSPICPVCGGGDLEEVPVAIVEKSRGTQLSVVGIRVVPLCWVCDAGTVRRWQANRPNPLMPDDLPNRFD